MSMTVAQIFAANPTTVVADTDLYYLVQSPYTPGTDAAISGLSLKAAFGSGGTINPGLINQLGYYAAAGSAISGLATLANGTLITSAAGAPSISQTLPSAVQGNITSLGTIGSGVWNGSVIGGTYGGTGVNNGASTITIGGNVTFSGAFTFAGTLTGNTAVTFPTSGTLATTSQIPSLPLSLANGGTATSLVANNGGIVYSNATTLAILAGTVTASQVLLSGSSTTPAWSTATYPSAAGSGGTVLRATSTSAWAASTFTISNTFAINTIPFASSANNLTAMSAAQNGVLVSSNTNVPSMLAGPGTTGNILQSNSAAAPSFSTATYPSTTTINNILFSSAANVVGQIAAVNGGVLVSNNTGVPSMLANPTATGRILQSANAAIPTWSTATFPATSGTSGNVMISDGTNYISSTSLWPNTVGTSGKVVISNGTSNVYSTPTFPNASATLNKIIKSDGTNWIASTETYAAPGTSGNVMTSDGTNWTSSSTAASGRIIGIQVFTASGSNTYTPSAGVGHATVCLWGGGGGGGASTSATIVGGSGGGGAYAESYVAVSGSVTIVIGGGGAGQLQNNGTAGVDGTDTTYATTTVVAKGGKHGANTTPGAASTGSTGTKTINGGAGCSPGTVVGLFPPGGQSPGMPLHQPGVTAVAAPANTGNGGVAGFLTGNASAGGSGYAVVYEYS